jgi:large subunit ribosomal protein L24
MKSKFAKTWNNSVQPRKQRKFRANAPLHVRHKFLSANLSKALRQKYGKRSLPLRKGDEVLVMRGRFKKKQAKIISVDLTRSKVTIEGLESTKRDGTKVSVPLSPRAVQIITIEGSEKKRIKSLASEKKEDNPVKKTEEKKDAKKEEKATSKTTGDKK